MKNNPLLTLNMNSGKAINSGNKAKDVLSTDRRRLKQSIVDKKKIAKVVKANLQNRLIMKMQTTNAKKVRKPSMYPRMVIYKIKRESITALKKVSFCKESYV